MATTAKLGAIRHRSNATQVDDYSRAYFGRAFETVDPLAIGTSSIAHPLQIVRVTGARGDAIVTAEHFR